MIRKSILKKIKSVKPHFFKNSIQNVFSWKELENLLNLRPLLSPDRFHSVTNESSLSWDDQAWVLDQKTYPPSTVGYLIQNHSCFIQDASRVNKKINNICLQLEQTFNGDCDAHIFFNLSNNLQEGFGIHHDKSHNLIVQVAGKSEVKVWNGLEKDNPEQIVICEIMHPGDAVFIPMDVSHCITSLTKRLSISFPINFNWKKEHQDRNWIVLE